VTRTFRRRVETLERQRSAEPLSAAEEAILAGPPGGREWCRAFWKQCQLLGGFAAVVEAVDRGWKKDRTQLAG
jgi:hypothetical protein